MPQKTVPCVVYRGGTSRGLFFHKRDLPDDAEEMKRIFLEGIDAYNPSQINGLGGATSHTSKVVVISPPTAEDVDINYTFVQIGIGSPVADSEGTCGNLMSAVGPFAIDEGLVKVSPCAREAIVSVYDTNIKKKLRLTVPLENGKAKVSGHYQMPGVLGTGAKIRVDITNPGGGKTGQTLPLGAVCQVKTPNGIYNVTFADIVNPLALVDIRVFGLTGAELNQEIVSNQELIEEWRKIRDEVGVMLGLAPTAEQVRAQSPAIPRITMVAPPQDYITSSGKQIKAEEIDILAKMLSMGRLHQTFAASGLYCVAAVSLLPGTIANLVARSKDRSQEQVIRIGHPGGIAEIRVSLTADGRDVDLVGMDRTARRIMKGKLFVSDNNIR